MAGPPKKRAIKNEESNSDSSEAESDSENYSGQQVYSRLNEIKKLLYVHEYKVCPTKNSPTGISK